MKYVLKTKTESARNTLGMEIEIVHVLINDETIGEFRDKRWAAFFARRIFEEGVCTPPEDVKLIASGTLHA